MTARARAVGRYFDAVATSYARRYADPGPAGHALVIRWQRTFELLGEATGPALDAGCGPGLLLEALGERGVTAVGVDLSRRMAAEAARRGRAVVATLDHLPFADATFGVVVAAGAVEYVADDRRAIAELVRVLRPGGVVVASFPNRFSPYRVWKNALFYPVVDRLRPLVARWRGRPMPVSVTAYHHHYTVGEVRATLAALGCAVEEVVFMNLQVVPSPLDEWWPSLSVALSRRLEALGRAPAGWLGTAFLVRAVKRSSGRLG